MNKSYTGNPFGDQLIELAPVAEINGTTVWFSKEPPTPDSDPVSLQEGQRKSAKMQSYLFLAAVTVAEKRGILSEDARKLFFPKVIKKGTIIDFDPIKEDITIEPELNFMDYLSSEQLEEFLMLQTETEDLPITATTAMMRTRLAYHVVITGTTANGFVVKTPGWPLTAGDRLKFDQAIVTVKSVKKQGKMSVVIFGESIEIPDNTTGFLMETDDRYYLGDKQWNEAKTRALILRTQIGLIYQFYSDHIRDQQAPEDEDEGVELGGNEGNTIDSSDTQNPPQLIGGEICTPNVALSESQPKTDALDMNALVGAQ